MNTEKTHYRKAFKSPYLSSADIVGPTNLTISHVVLKGDASKKSKDLFNTAYFVEKEIRRGEPLKPMILNVVNSKMLYSITGSHFLEDWAGARVEVRVQGGIKFGRDVVEGLRIYPQKARPVINPNNKKQWEGAKAAFVRDGNFDAVLVRADLSPEQQQQIINEVANV